MRTAVQIVAASIAGFVAACVAVAAVTIRALYGLRDFDEGDEE